MYFQENIPAHNQLILSQVSIVVVFFLRVGYGLTVLKHTAGAVLEGVSPRHAFQRLNKAHLHNFHKFTNKFTNIHHQNSSRTVSGTGVGEACRACLGTPDTLLEMAARMSRLETR